MKFKLALCLLILAPLSSISPAKIQPLDIWYQAYNATLFSGELPDKIEIDHQLRDPNKMAETKCELISRVCRINMNPDYEISSSITRMTLIHEQCHIDLFILQEYELDQHGPKWESCMHDKADKKAFDNLW